MFLYRLSVMSRRRIFPSPIALAIAAIVASSARTPSSYMRPFATAFVAVVHRHGPSGVTSSRISSRCSTDLNGRHHRGSLENHFYMDGDEDGYIDKRQLEYPHNVNHVHIDNRPHGYRDPQAQMEMPNNVYIDGELHVGGYGPRKKSANDIEPAEAYEILDLPDGCADKTTIKKAYYDLVAKVRSCNQTIAYKLRTAVRRGTTKVMLDIYYLSIALTSHSHLSIKYIYLSVYLSLYPSM